MGFLEKVCDWVVWLLIFGGIIGLFVGVFELIDLLLIRSHHG